jgi:hypothetical protein
LNRFHLYALTMALFVLGLSLFLYKVLALKFPLTPTAQADVWNVEARITFVAGNKPVKVSLYLPGNTKQFAIMDENFISRGYGLVTAKETEYGNRQCDWSKRRVKGDQSLYYRSVVRRINGEEKSVRSRPPYVEPFQFEGPHLAAAEALILEIQEQSADVDSLVAELTKRLNRPHPDDNVSVLIGKKTTILKKMNVAVRVLGKMGIPARVVQGIRLEDQNRNAPVVKWLEVYDGTRWKPYDPVTGAGGIPDEYLPWWRGPDPIGRLKGGDRLQIGLAVSANQEAATTAAIEGGGIAHPLLVSFSLFSLPIRTQGVYRVLLLIPVGGFLMVVLRNVIGITTFGTFMPVLIALAFRETRLLWGIFLFVLVVGFGLSIRFYLEHLKLLLVPRLAAVLTVVVLLMVALSLLTHKLGLERGPSVALFPMVILTMTIERMSVVWEELGAGQSLSQGVGSLIVASLAYLVMSASQIQHLVFVFPELLLVLLAVTILLGRYSGYRLVELWRFRALVKKER